MSRNNDFYKVLKEYITTGDEVLKRKLQGLMTHPSYVQNCSFLPDDHPLRKEAILIHDGFECVTNGMTDPDLLKQVKEIEDNSLFRPWRDLIMSFIFLYGNDMNSLERVLGGISEESVPGKLIPVFKAFIKKDCSFLDERQQKFFSEVFKRNNVLADLAVQLQECRESGLMDHFFQALTFFLRELKKEEPEWMEKGVVWALDQLIQEGPLSEDLVPLLSTVFPRSEVFRLLSLVSYEYDLDRSLFFWIDSLEELICAGNPPRQDILLRLDIVKEMWTLVQERYDVTEQYRAGVKDRLASLEETLNHSCPDKDWNIQSLTDLVDNENTLMPEPHRTTRFVQLELAF